MPFHKIFGMAMARSSVLTCVAIVWVFFAGTASTLADAPNLTVSAIGQITIRGKQIPGFLHISVRISDEDAVDATSKTNATTDNIVALLRCNGVDSTDINIQPLEVREVSGEMPRQSFYDQLLSPGFVALSELDVIFRSDEQLRQAKLALQKIKALRIDGPYFRDPNVNGKLRQALKTAFETARQSAEIRATATGHRLGRLIGAEVSMDGRKGSSELYHMQVIPPSLILSVEAKYELQD